MMIVMQLLLVMKSIFIMVIAMIMMAIMIQNDECDDNDDDDQLTLPCFLVIENITHGDIVLKVDYHPSLVWTEINSFIKGSFKALTSPQGYLDKKEYQEVGRKEAPNFTADREKVGIYNYQIFLADVIEVLTPESFTSR